MTAAAIVFGYAVAVAWLAPSLLTRLTGHGVSARLGLAAWLAAMISSLACAGVAVGLLVGAAVSGWPRFAAAVCREVAGQACTPVVYRSLLYEIGLAAAALVAALTAAALAVRYARRMGRARRRTRAHAEAARLTCRPGMAETFVLDAVQPVAYCVPGRPATIVVTSGALSVLDEPQLCAVLAHERAHLSGRHHLLVAITRCLAATLPWVPLFGRGAAAVSRLAEMCADDRAARQAGRRVLLDALLAIGTARPPAAALGFSGGAVASRALRLLDPPARGRRAVHALALSSVIVTLNAAPALLVTFAAALPR
jgi:Zn-dependent protease with chaperone function